LGGLGFAPQLLDELDLALLLGLELFVRSPRTLGFITCALGLVDRRGLSVADPNERDSRRNDQQREQRDRAGDRNPPCARSAIGEAEHGIDVHLLAPVELAAVVANPA